MNKLYVSNVNSKIEYVIISAEYDPEGNCLLGKAIYSKSRNYTINKTYIWKPNFFDEVKNNKQKLEILKNL